MDTAKVLREKLENKQLVWAPAAWDVTSALVIEEAGYDAVHLPSGESAIRDGVPDNGFLQPGEMLELTRKVCKAVKIPVIVDFEQGFGDLYNTVNWMNRFEEAGAAALHIDDYPFQYKCPFIPPYLPNLRPLDEIVGQIKAMVGERINPNTVIIVRTGAQMCRGLGASENRQKEAILRYKAFEEAGADVLFSMAPTAEEFIAVRKEVKKPMLVQLGIGASQPKDLKGGVGYGGGLVERTVDELFELGAAIVTDPNTLHAAAVRGMKEAAALQREGRSIIAAAEKSYPFSDANQFMDIERQLEIIKKYGGFE